MFIGNKIWDEEKIISRIENDEASNLSLETLVKITEELNGEI